MAYALRPTIRVHSRDLRLFSLERWKEVEMRERSIIFIGVLVLLVGVVIILLGWWKGKGVSVPKKRVKIQGSPYQPSISQRGVGQIAVLAS